MSLAYGQLASLYDRLLDVDYAAAADFMLAQAEALGCHPKLGLDLACGTANLTLALNGRIAEMIALDASPEMLGQARAKLGALSSSVQLTCQDMTDFELYGTVDFCACVLDGLNYLTHTSLLKRALELVYFYSDPGAVFIFDVKTPACGHRLDELGSFVLEDGDSVCICRNSYSSQSGRLNTDVTLVVPYAGTYQRLDEAHTQRLYAVSTVRRLALEAGFTLQGLFDGYRNVPYTPQTERAVFVLQKPR